MAARAKRGEHFDHYLDDFIVWGSPGSPRCQEALDEMRQCCTQLGVPLATHETEGPTTCLTFLEITIDTNANELLLPNDKLARLRALLIKWGDWKACSQSELESLIEILNHACKVVCPGRSFLRRMLNLLKSPHAQNICRRAAQQIHLNKDFRSDLLWWQVFAEQCNRIAIASPRDGDPPVELTFGASGCGVWSGTVQHGFNLGGTTTPSCCLLQ